MAIQDKALLMTKVEGTLKNRMFANLYEEATTEIQDHLSLFDVKYIPQDESPNDDLLERFISAKATGGLSEKTLLRYQYEIGRFMRFSKVRTKDVCADTVRAYFKMLSSKGVSNNSIESLRQLLNGYFNWLKEMKLIPINPLFEIEKIHIEKKVKPVLSKTDIAVMEVNLNNLRDNAIIHFFLATGCRIGEVINLNREDVNLDECECDVHGKGNKQRTVYMDEVAVLFLREYLASRDDDCEALFINRYNKRLGRTGYRDLLNKIAQKVGVDHVHPHRFRRTMITYLLDRGMPIQEVAVLVGHESVNTTMKYYTASKARIKNSYMKYNI